MLMVQLQLVFKHHENDDDATATKMMKSFLINGIAYTVSDDISIGYGTEKSMMVKQLT